MSSRHNATVVSRKRDRAPRTAASHPPSRPSSTSGWPYRQRDGTRPAQVLAPARHDPHIETQHAAKLAEALEATRKREAAERKARDERVREEERQSLLKRLDKMPARDRPKFLEEQKVLAAAQALAAKLKREPTKKHAVDLAIFGIDFDGGAC